MGNWDLMSDVGTPEDMLADMVIEHDMVGVLCGDEFEIQMAPLAAGTDYFYPGAVEDEFGMLTGGWPTDIELEENRRMGA